METAVLVRDRGDGCQARIRLGYGAVKTVVLLFVSCSSRENGCLFRWAAQTAVRREPGSEYPGAVETAAESGGCSQDSV